MDYINMRRINSLWSWAFHRLMCGQWRTCAPATRPRVMKKETGSVLNDIYLKKSRKRNTNCIVVTCHDEDDDDDDDDEQLYVFILPYLSGAYRLCVTRTFFHTCQEPIDCALQEWSSWTECSKTCGGGEQTRERKIEAEARHNGKPMLLLSHSSILWSS